MLRLLCSTSSLVHTLEIWAPRTHVKDFTQLIPSWAKRSSANYLHCVHLEQALCLSSHCTLKQKLHEATTDHQPSMARFRCVGATLASKVRSKQCALSMGPQPWHPSIPILPILYTVYTLYAFRVPKRPYQGPILPT